MKVVDNQARIQELGEDISDLCEAFADLPSFEVGYQLIAHATIMMLKTAPNHLVAMKTIMASVEIGIMDYQERHKDSVE